MDSLRHLVSAQQDTIAQYRQQIADLSQQQPQIVSSPDTDANRSLYVIIAILVAALLLLLMAYLYERRRAKREVEDLQYQLDRTNTQLQSVQKQLDEKKAQPAPAPIPAAPAPAPAPTPTPAPAPAPRAAQPARVSGSSFEGIYDGKSLYESMLAGTCASIDQWSSVDVNNFIEYYRLNHREFVDGLEADYNHLSRNHKMFLILLDMGKTDAEIQKLMNITQTTIRSIRFRIKAKRKAGSQPADPQTSIKF